MLWRIRLQGLILLDNTKDITSFGAVARIKHLCGEKRVGHTGTLDPLATGVLPVLIGKATALSVYMLDADKKYAIVMGNEVKGVQQEVVNACDGCIEIPQYGTKHSLNVSVTAGIVMYELSNMLR